MQEMRVHSLGGEDPLEEGVTTHSSTLAWRNPWTEEPGGLQSTGLHRAEHSLGLNSSKAQCLGRVSAGAAGVRATASGSTRSWKSFDTPCA